MKVKTMKVMRPMRRSTVQNATGATTVPKWLAMIGEIEEATLPSATFALNALQEQLDTLTGPFACETAAVIASTSTSAAPAS